MNILPGLLILLGAFAMAVGLTRVIALNAARLQLVQIPNARSSHSLPTPSGGGVAVAITSIVAALVLWPQDAYACLSIGVCGCAALLGFLDDRNDLPATVRFGCHLLFAGTFTLYLFDFPASWDFGAWLFVCSMAVASVWWINLFNFMDGIDGLAGSQSVFMLIAAVTLAMMNQAWQIDWMGWWALATAGAVLGFLTFNWPPARIFMGDAGSNFLAVALLAIFLWLYHSGLVAVPALLLVVALFTSDATVTLVRRMISGEKWWSAHRQHAYQRLSRAWGGHRPVTVLYTLINVLWLYPCAYIAATTPEISWLVVVVGYLPLVAFSLFVAEQRSAPMT